MFEPDLNPCIVLYPTTTLFDPVICCNDWYPTAVLFDAKVAELDIIAEVPIARLPLAVVNVANALAPIAKLKSPVVILPKVFAPIAILS